MLEGIQQFSPCSNYSHEKGAFSYCLDGCDADGSSCFLGNIDCSSDDVYLLFLAVWLVSIHSVVNLSIEDGLDSGFPILRHVVSESGGVLAHLNVSRMGFYAASKD